MRKRYYSFWVLLLLAIEVCIALFIKTGIIRHFVGDILAVILVYCFLRLVSSWAVQKAAFVALIVGFVIELIQFTDLGSKLGIDTINWLRIMVGTTADPWDIIAYSLGFIVILIAESLVPYPASKPSKNP